ncbi:zinc-finger of transposase IS204/IS1001/IS1096/IS1165 [[Clostridium] aminophilum]|uniref:Zinc-finger of transposase IS204/IS1001/IS1096/IS1165 n=1 Tax=[Clostridium] aminophilum TaxID=1526 RepID=A0A1I0GL20_9FIRM|nr:transposase family protein [[Clostridium] aminophilum]SET71670.1 zinc-finger of transposase IS204/IS1001/IS1096/IS1165 [[Clostridium] aminophilum]
MDSVISSLGGNYTISRIQNKEGMIVYHIGSELDELECPYCGRKTGKVHSYHSREIQDLPVSNQKTILIVATRKMQCLNQECSHKYFSEQHPFATSNARKTNRLVDRILKMSSEVSSVCSSKLLKGENISVGKSTICSMLKKNACNCG